MAARFGAQRMVQTAEVMIGLSLALFLALPFWLSLTLFLGGWALFGSARIVEGFAQAEPDHTPVNAPPRG